MPRKRLERPNFRLRFARGKRGGSWYIDWTDNSVTPSVPKSVSTRTADRAEAERQRQQLAAGYDKPAPPEQPSIGAICDGYLAERKDHVEAYATLDYACQAIKRHIGGVQPGQLSRKTYWDRRRADGVAAGTIIREGVTLRAALKWAAREKWITKAEIPYIQLPSKGTSRERWLTRGEAENLVAAALTPHMRLFFLMAIHTAARRGAILDLTWDRVDMERRRIHFKRPGRAETKKQRTTVPINDALIGVLQESFVVRTSDYVIEYHGGPIASVKTAFRDAVARAGIEYCTPHDLRRTAATWMAEANIEIRGIAKFLGDTEETVRKHYEKFRPDYLSEEARALAGVKRLKPVKEEQA